MPVGGKRQGAGRPKGAPNKRTLEVAERLAKLGCDPIVGMARIAMGKNNPMELRGRMFAELAQYIAPKRRAIEHSTDLPTLEALLGRLDD
ncbi:MAG TPA: hypothetical protein VNU68_35480 [Verrucomicrobiae bacterium]|nr:hypothetical protein [Verrucomicrobiae bacterium]